MTNQELVVHIKAKYRFPKTFNDYMDYSICCIALSFFALGVFPIINYFKHPDEAILLLLSVFIIPLSFFFLRFNITRLKENITFELARIKNQDFDTILQKITSNFNLQRIETDKTLGLISAFTKMSSFSWGEKLTLIIEDDIVLINSRPSTIQPITIMKDRDNIKKIKQLLIS